MPQSLVCAVQTLSCGEGGVAVRIRGVGASEAKERGSRGGIEERAGRQGEGGGGGMREISWRFFFFHGVSHVPRVMVCCVGSISASPYRLNRKKTVHPEQHSF